MDWLAKYWWILVLVFLVGVMINVIKDLKRVDPKKFMANKPDLPPHRDFNDKWDDDDEWPKKNHNRKKTPLQKPGRFLLCSSVATRCPTGSGNWQFHQSVIPQCLRFSPSPAGPIR